MHTPELRVTNKTIILTPADSEHFWDEVAKHINEHGPMTRLAFRVDSKRRPAFILREADQSGIEWQLEIGGHIQYYSLDKSVQTRLYNMVNSCIENL